MHIHEGWILDSMMTSLPHEEVYGNQNEVSQEDCLEGTSARTRPLHFNEIMVRRKNRGSEVKQVADDTGVSDIALAGDSVKKAIHSMDYDGQNTEDVPMNSRRTSNDSQNVSSRRKGSVNASRKNEKLLRDKGSRDPDAKPKVTVDENVHRNRVTAKENEVRHHRNRNRDGFSFDDSNLRQTKGLGKKDRAPERTRVKSEIVREQHDDRDRHVDRKRKIDERLSSIPEKNFKKINATDVIRTDKLSDRGKDKPEKENRHKRHNEEDKTRGRSTSRKHDSEKGLDLNRVYPEESRPKKRRSRSRDRDKERVRRSHSHSPKVHKANDKRNHGQPSPHSTKHRVVREHSDVDKNKISSSHYRRNTGSSSGLGGYSPRKRKSETAAKTPSPSRRSPERKTAGWDFPPVGKESIHSGSAPSDLHTSSQNIPPNVKEFPSIIPVTPTMVKPVGISHLTLSSQMHAMESIQLTQATRPMRRLYAENIPALASEKDLKECINKFLLSSGVNYIQGTQRCISCIIHKEKGQALLEFLTPEDASAALSFDGLFFSGSNLKFRRPKDYADVTTGLPEKSAVAVDSVVGIVDDSPHKIFIGGISKFVSSKMLLEIAKAFGPVKAYHFESVADSNEQCAFLEYVDHSVNSKACAGLSGMRLGGQVITAVFATPDTVLLENIGKPPCYGIPEHAKPLLEKPTAVLKLKNVLDPEGLLSLSESELEDIVEDIRLECSRFGMVRSINIAKPTYSFTTIEAHETKNADVSTDGCGLNTTSNTIEKVGNTINRLGEQDGSEPSEALNESENNTQTAEDNKGRDSLSDTLMHDGMHERPSDGVNSSVGDPSTLENHDGFTEKPAIQQSASVDVLESMVMENESLVEEALKSEETNAEIGNDAGKELDASAQANKKDILTDFDNVFEPGSVFVEYKRAEAACTAAHSLHGRIFDGHVVMAGYVAHDLYHKRFHK